MTRKGRIAALATLLYAPFAFAGGTTFLLERRIESPASMTDTHWTLYLDRVPGTSVRCRGPGETELHVAPPDGAGHFECVVPRAPGLPRGVVPVAIAYESWLGFTRNTTFHFDAARWDDDKMWSGYYSSGYAVVSPFDAGRVRFHVWSTPLTSVRYSFDSDAVDRTLPEGVAEIAVPPGARSITTCLFGRGRRSFGTELVRSGATTYPDVVRDKTCPPH